MDRTHRPNLFGCWIGFGAAGAGIGSFVGMAIGAQVVRDIPEAHDPLVSGMPLHYLWLFRGIAGGMVTGAILGVGYAQLRNWLAWETGSEPRRGGRT